MVARSRIYSAGTTVGTLSVGPDPEGVAFDGANIWVANSGSNNVTELRASDGTTLGTFSVGEFQFSGIAFDGANIWVSGLGDVIELRASDGTIVNTFGPFGVTSGIAFDGADIWVVGVQAEVFELRQVDGTILRTRNLQRRDRFQAKEPDFP